MSTAFFLRRFSSALCLPIGRSRTHSRTRPKILRSVENKELKGTIQGYNPGPLAILYNNKSTLRIMYLRYDV